MLIRFQTEVWFKTEFKTWFKRKDKVTQCVYTVSGKKVPSILPLTLPNTNRFSKYFQRKTLQQISVKAVIKSRSTPQICCYTTLWNVCAQKFAMPQSWMKQTHMLTCKTQPFTTVAYKYPHTLFIDENIFMTTTPKNTEWPLMKEFWKSVSIWQS